MRTSGFFGNVDQKFRDARDQDDELADRLVRDFEYLQSQRGNWNSHWTEIAQRILPMDSFLFQSWGQNVSKGEKRNQELFDATGLIALQRFAAILDSLLTPADQQYGMLRPTDDRLLKDKQTKLWYENANNILFRERYAPTTNFAANNQGVYMSLGAYGTGALFIDRLQGKKGLRYKNVHLSQCFLRENHQGIVDTNFRRFNLTARQAYQQFGEQLPDTILTVYKDKPDTEFPFLHVALPNETYDPERLDYQGMEFSCHYISLEGKRLVRANGEQKGYVSFPYAIPRYYQSATEAYGRSVAMDVLPSLKTLNEQKKTMLKQGHRVVDPVLLAHDDGVIDGFSLEPGAMNVGGISADGRRLVDVLPTGNIAAGKDFMEEERSLIKDAFLTSIFQILVESPQQTATEVLERAREKGILLAPTVGRQQSEYVGPVTMREIDLLSQQGMLPPMTPAMREAKGEYKVVYDSPITRAQKSERAAGAQRTIQTLVEMAQATQDPSYLFYIDMDQAAPQIAKINGTPDSWIRDEATVKKMKAAHAQAMQQQQALQAAPAMAGVMKAHAQTQQIQQGGGGQGNGQ